jgi:alpha-glucosidase
VTGADWWRQAAVYQIYPRSFADANGDGIGDLAGITSRIPYLASLGVDAVWLSPFYPSALADGGYDVDDYRDVDPRLGTLDDFDRMIGALHAAGIRLVADLVPNHSSDRHEWFRAALAAAPGSPERARYIFRDGLGPDGALPPSDWQSIFGGPAWQRVPDGQWYLHLFAPEQPDLNWDNPEVRADFVRTLRFWSDRGVDGFRVDVAHGLAKRLTDPLPSTEELAGLGPGAHPLWDRDEVHDIYAEWRRVFQEYDPPRTAVAEAWVEPGRRARYAHPEGLGQAFSFDLLEADYDAEGFRRIIADNLAFARESGSSTTWVFSNHDVVRHATRYGLPVPGDGGPQKGREWLLSGGIEPALDRERGLRRARAATLLMLALPGSAYLYQGEELGLHEVAEIPDEDRQDPTFFRNAGVEIGRDGCRVPIPWTRGGSSFGFGTDGAHLPQPTWFGAVSVEAEEGDDASTLSLYRRALALRRRLQGPEELRWRDTGIPSVLAFKRPGGWCAVMNFGPDAAALPEGELLLASARR